MRNKTRGIWRDAYLANLEGVSTIKLVHVSRMLSKLIFYLKIGTVDDRLMFKKINREIINRIMDTRKD